MFLKINPIGKNAEKVYLSCYECLHVTDRAPKIPVKLTVFSE